MLWNPFDDVVPRNLKPKIEPANDKPTAQKTAKPKKYVVSCDYQLLASKNRLKIFLLLLSMRLSKLWVQPSLIVRSIFRLSTFAYI